MLLKRKEDGKLFKIISGYILPEEKRIGKRVDGAFITLQDTENPENTVLYIWPYYGEQEYTIVEESTEGELQ